tara:strand:+ start:8124 stop:8804 length:681 start_codon:yes stop_codon:yes gene_type:complete
MSAHAAPEYYGPNDTVTIGDKTIPRLEYEEMMLKSNLSQTKSRQDVARRWLAAYAADTPGYAEEHPEFFPVEAEIRERLYACKTVDELLACDLVGDVDRARCATLRERLELTGDMLPEQATHLQPGDEVTLTGLTTAAHLNGSKGSLGTYDAAADRWGMPDLAVRVRPTNVIADKWLHSGRQNNSIDVDGFSYMVRFELDETIRWLWPKGRLNMTTLILKGAYTAR